MARSSHLALLCVIGFAACSEKQRQPTLKVAADSAPVAPVATATDKQIEVVAALVGYELQRSLPTEQTIVYYTLDPQEGHDALGFLFAVLEPSDVKGALFHLHHDGIQASGDPETLYKKDTRYRFNLNASDLITITDAGCSLRPLGRPVANMTAAEAHALLVRYQDQRKAADDKIEAITEALNKEKQQPNGGNTDTISKLQSTVDSWNRRREELGRRIRKLEDVQSNGISSSGVNPQQPAAGEPSTRPEPK